MATVYAMLPCYNEEENITELIEEWEKQRDMLRQEGYELTIVGIDDCSRDSTKQKMSAMAKKYNNVHIEAHTVNKGLCGGLNTAISYFIKNGGERDLLVLMDGDNTHDPAYVHQMISKVCDDTECVIASRYCSSSQIIGVAKHRIFFSDMARYYYRLILRVPNVQDYTCGYRIYTYAAVQRLLKRFGDDPIKEKSFACMMELLYKLHLVGVRFDEVGFKLRYDQKLGKSKMSVIKTAARSLTTALALRKEKGNA